MDIVSAVLGLSIGAGIGGKAHENLKLLQRERERTLSDFLPWSRPIRRNLITTTEDDYLAVFKFAARDVGTMHPGEVFEVARRVAVAIGALKPKPQIKVQLYAVGEEVREYLRPPAGSVQHPVLEAADDERAAYFEANPGFETARYLAIAWRPSDDDLARLRTASSKANLEEALAIDSRLVGEFEMIVARLESSLRDAFASVERLGSYTGTGSERKRSRLLEFLHFFVSGKFTPFPVPDDSIIELCGLLASRGLDRRGEVPKIGDEYVLPILLKSFPAEAEPGVLDALTRVGVPHYLTLSYYPLTLADVQHYAKRVVLDFQAQANANKSFIDPGAADSAEEAADAYGAAKGALTAFGWTTPTIVIRARSLAELSAARNAILTAIESDFPNCYIPDHMAAFNAVVATFPGASRGTSVHKHLEHALGIATLMPLHAHDRGREYNGSLYRVAKTPPHFYAFGRGQALTRVHTDVGQIGHGFGLAKSGRGKTTIEAYQGIMRLARLPLSGLGMFDKGLGAYRAALMCDGTVYDPLGDSLGIALFDGVEDDLVAEDVLKILTEMLVLWGVKPTPEEDESLRRAMFLLSHDPPEYRSMSHFVGRLIDDTTRLKPVLVKYTDAGALGGLLDATSDAFAISDWTVVDLHNVFNLPQELLVPIIRTLAFKIARSVEKKKKSLGDFGRFYQYTLNIDESHLLQKHPAGERLITDLLKTGRARNMSVFLWSNGLDEMAGTASRTELLTQCGTRIFGGDPAVTDEETRAKFRSLQLNERGLNWLPNLEPWEFLFHQPDIGLLQPLNPRLDGPLLAMIGDPRTNHVVDEFRDRWPAHLHGLHEWKIRLLEHDGEHAFAARLRAKIDAHKAHETPGALITSREVPV